MPYVPSSIRWRHLGIAGRILVALKILLTHPVLWRLFKELARNPVEFESDSWVVTRSNFAYLTGPAVMAVLQSQVLRLLRNYAIADQSLDILPFGRSFVKVSYVVQCPGVRPYPIYFCVSDAGLNL